MNKVACFDGGGACGIISLYLMKELDKNPEDYFGFAGISIGAAIACALADDFALEYLIPLFKSVISRIFHRSWKDKLLNPFGLFEPLYSRRRLQSELEAIFGEKTLGKLSKPVVIITTDRFTFKPVILYSETHSDMKIVDAILASTAAPGYFPAHDRFIDGGLSANNPSLFAYFVFGPNLIIDSFGTGSAEYHLWKRSSFLRLLPDIASILLRTSEKVVSYQMKYLPNVRYHRYDISLPKKLVRMDDARLKTMSARMSLVKQYISALKKYTR